MVSTKEYQTHKSSLSHKLWVRNDVCKPAAQHIESRNDVLPLSLSFVLFHPRHKAFHLFKAFLLNRFLLHPSLLKGLLFETSFKLVFVLHRLPLHLLLAGYRVLVQRSSLLAHLFFLRQLLLIPLKLQLDLVFCLAFGHLDLKLLRFAFFVLCNLDLRYSKFPIKVRHSKLTLYFPAAQDVWSLPSSWRARKLSLRFDFHRGILRP